MHSMLWSVFLLWLVPCTAAPRFYLPVRDDPGHASCMATVAELTRIARDMAATTGGSVDYAAFGAAHAHYNDSGSVWELADLTGSQREHAFRKDELCEYNFCRGHENGEGACSVCFYVYVAC